MTIRTLALIHTHAICREKQQKQRQHTRTKLSAHISFSNRKTSIRKKILGLSLKKMKKTG